MIPRKLLRTSATSARPSLAPNNNEGILEMFLSFESLVVDAVRDFWTLDVSNERRLRRLSSEHTSHRPQIGCWKLERLETRVSNETRIDTAISFPLVLFSLEEAFRRTRRFERRRKGQREEAVRPSPPL